MSAFVLYTVRCDEPSCTRRGVFAEESLTEARELEAGNGWRHRRWPARNGSGPSPSLDLCPVHGFHADADSPPFPSKATQERQRQKRQRAHGGR